MASPPRATTAAPRCCAAPISLPPANPATCSSGWSTPPRRGETPGLGACTGDSGGPVYEERDGKRVVYGVISWTTGPKLSDGCGGLTGVTPLELHLTWIADTARKLGSPLTP